MEQAQSNPVARRFENLTNLFYLMVGLPLVAFIWVYLNLKQLQPLGYFADPSVRIYLHIALLALALALGLLAFLQYRKRFDGLEPSRQESADGNVNERDADKDGLHHKDAPRWNSLNGDSQNRDSRKDVPRLSPQLNRKFEVFRTASMQKYLLLTASTVLVVLGYYLSAEEYYGAFYGILIVIFSVHRPTPERFMRDMRLKKEERQALREALNHGRRLPQKEEK